MFNLIFGDSAPQMNAAFNNRMAVLRKQHQVLITNVLPDFISMAKI